MSHVHLDRFSFCRLRPRTIPLLIILTSPATVIGQTPTHISSRPACPGCVVHARVTTRLIDDERAAQLGEMLMLTRDSRGLLYGTDLTMGAGQVRVFDAAGRFLRAFGRDGDGPGEFRQIIPPSFGKRDTIYVMDYAHRRLTQLAPSGRYLASYILGGAPSQLIVLDSGFLVAGNIRTAEHAGWPIHLLDRAGRVRKSFGSDLPVMNVRNPMLSRRVIALAASKQHVWSAAPDRYLLELWDFNGRRNAVIVRDPEWFQPSDSYVGPATVVKPPTRVTALWHDSADRLWVAITVPDADWRRTDFRAKEGDMIPMPRANNHRIYDTILEVIDWRRGTLLTSFRSPLHLQTMGNGQPLISYEEDEFGHPIYKVWEFILDEPRR